MAQKNETGIHNTITNKEAIRLLTIRRRRVGGKLQTRRLVAQHKGQALHYLIVNN